MLHTRILRDSQDVDFHATGVVVGGFSELLLDPAQLKTEPTHCKIQAIAYAIESGLQLRLWWEQGEADNLLIVPLEGRGILDVGRFGGFENPRLPGHTGRIWLTAQGSKESSVYHFFLALELTKQRIG